MKLGEIVDDCMDHPTVPLVIELPNGTKTPTTGFYYDFNKRGEHILVITVKKPTK
jgi:hypothetical protein